MRHWTTTVVLIAAFAMCAVVADNVSTALCLDILGDVVEEANPLSEFLMGFWGITATMVANAIWSAVAIIWLVQQAVERRANFALILLLSLALVRGFAAVNNFSILAEAIK